MRLVSQLIGELDLDHVGHVDGTVPERLRPKGDSRLPAHIMAAVRDTIRAAAATCVEPARLEASGPYEWLAIVEAHDDELSRLLRSYIESCRYLDELQHGAIDVGHARLAAAVRDATFARDSIHRSLVKAIGVAD